MRKGGKEKGRTGERKGRTKDRRSRPGFLAVEVIFFVFVFVVCVFVILVGDDCHCHQSCRSNRPRVRVCVRAFLGLFV